MYSLEPDTIKWLARGFLLLIIIIAICLIIRSKRRANANANASANQFQQQREYIYSGLRQLSFTDLLIPPTIKNGMKMFGGGGCSGRTSSSPSPSVNKTEEMCRKIIEKIYNRKFPSVRPNWLRSPRTGKNLELDCYNKDLKIAIEYNGQQHYRYTPHFHKTKTKFYSQVHRDDWKRKKCIENGVRLIEIPYWIQPMDLENYIRRELAKKNCL